MQTNTDAWRATVRKILGYIFIVVVVIALVVGVLTILRFIIRIVTQLNYSVLSPEGDWLRNYVWPHPDGWLTAISTALLFWVTLTLSRVTQEQGARDAPLLRFALSRNDSIVQPLLEYDEGWNVTDFGTTALRNFIVTDTLYIFLEVTNEQSQSFGVATDIKVSLALSWGANDDIAQHPHRIDRVVVIPALGAGKQIGGPVFNVGKLPNYLVQVTEVSYADIAGKKRRASYGTGNFWQRVNNVPPIMTETVFKPTKREIGR